MLKKAGIVVAAAAAGLLAVSPLAFAGDKGHDVKSAHGGDNTAVNSVSDDSNTVGLVNVADNEVNVPVQACNNDVAVGVAGGAVNEATAALAGAASLLGSSAATSDATDNEVRDCAQSNSSGGAILQNIG